VLVADMLFPSAATALVTLTDQSSEAP